LPVSLTLAGTPTLIGVTTLKALLELPLLLLPVSLTLAGTPTLIGVITLKALPDGGFFMDINNLKLANPYHDGIKWMVSPPLP
jgi:hypothetical protein